MALEGGPAGVSDPPFLLLLSAGTGPQPNLADRRADSFLAGEADPGSFTAASAARDMGEGGGLLHLAAI